MDESGDSGERLVVHPNSNNILFFGAMSENGLYKSTDYGSTWTQVSSMPDVETYVADATDTSDYTRRSLPWCGLRLSTLTMPETCQ
ncbi:hypothetical protein DFS33DRAFT_1304337 [Desarmillaria ectypa]|nr:hypothetical protein DFS33DRAFT_1304337 [Desarmillaria ectypa]